MATVKGDPEQARKINRSLILDEVRKKGLMSRAEIARALSISKMTVSTIVAELVDDSIFAEQTSPVGASSAGGRKPVLLSFDRNSHFLIGVDIGTTNMTLVLGNLNGETLERMRMPTGQDRSVTHIIDHIEELVSALIERSGIQRSEIAGVGFSVSGLVDKSQGYVEYSPDFAWRDVYFRKLVEDRLSLPVVIDNCSRVAALGEIWHGAAGEVETFFYANVGYGIGSAIVTNQKIYNNNSEFGHINVTNRLVKCDCGKQGCLEAVSSGHAIEKAANAMVAQPSRLHWTTAKELAEQARLGNEPAQKIFQDAGKYLGRGLSTVANLLSPELLIVGGGVSGAGAILMDPLMREFDRHTMEPIKNKSRVVVSELDMDAGVIGATSLAMNEFVVRTGEILR